MSSHQMMDGTERPIAFVSRSLSKAEQNYSLIEREALSIVWGVKKFQLYLYLKEFTLVTDHKPLTVLFNNKGNPFNVISKDTEMGIVFIWTINTKYNLEGLETMQMLMHYQDCQ